MRKSKLKEAIDRIDLQLQDNPELDRVKLVDDTSRTLDMGPLDAGFLHRHISIKKLLHSSE